MLVGMTFRIFFSCFTNFVNFIKIRLKKQQIFKYSLKISKSVHSGDNFFDLNYLAVCVLSMTTNRYFTHTENLE